MGAGRKATLEEAALTKPAACFFNFRNWDFIVPQMNNSSSSFEGELEQS
jgi:hypothetical protein